VEKYDIAGMPIVQVAVSGTLPMRDLTRITRKRVKEILETATRWNAILLIDECDIFLEARKEDDMHRNAVVSVFLRMVEYYQGILFLTTNRVKDLDTAFYSRISLPIKYDALGSDARRSIWINHLMTNGVGRDKAEEFANQIHQNFSNNGRQIKNVVRIALSLATKENRELQIDDLVKVLRYLEKFDLSK
jgi:SpoVK/Ycf46/Vps4 family AAA+-type ATPase